MNTSLPTGVIKCRRFKGFSAILLVLLALVRSLISSSRLVGVSSSAIPAVHTTDAAAS
jgi:hypothetical protein